MDFIGQTGKHLIQSIEKYIQIGNVRSGEDIKYDLIVILISQVMSLFQKVQYKNSKIFLVNFQKVVWMKVMPAKNNRLVSAFAAAEIDFLKMCSEHNSLLVVSFCDNLLFYNERMGSFD